MADSLFHSFERSNNMNNEENNKEKETLNENIEELNQISETEEIIAEETEEKTSENSANYPKKKKKKSPARELFEWVQAIVIAVVVAFLVKTFVFGVVQVEGSSMEPTLQTNDRMILWKLGYDPEPGDIVVFSNTMTNGNPWIKRVIATEGDHVRIDYSTNKVYVNDKLQSEPYINVCLCSSCSGDSMKPRGEFNDIVVPEGCIFAMGDNRNHSEDCRSIGPVSENDIMGKAILRFWPFKNIKTY